MDRKTLDSIRQSVVEAGLVLARSSMTIGTYGNISQRVDADHIAITPSGRDYEQLTPADIVVTDMEGTIAESSSAPVNQDFGHKPSAADSVNTKEDRSSAIAPLRPSSELPLHLEKTFRRHRPSCTPTASMPVRWQRHIRICRPL